MNKLLEFYQNMQKDLEERGRRQLNDDVLIFDGLNMFIRLFSAVPALNDNGDHVGGVTGFLKSLAWTIRQFKPSRCIIVFDGKGGSSRRRKLYPEYKANRINKMSFNRYDEFSSKDEEEESMKIQMSRLVEYLNVLPITVISIDMVEADDVIAYLTQSLCEKKVTIVSTDKDFIQLINDRINVWRPTTKELYDRNKVIEAYNIRPENFLLWRLFDGDSSDNIEGVKGVGLKTLIKEFPELSTDILTFDDVLDKSDQKLKNLKKPKKIINLILNSKERLELNYKLMQLADVDIAGEIKNRIRNIFNTSPSKTNHLNLRKLLIEDRFNTIIKDPETWIRNSFSELDTYAK